ncbi:E3 ubiquitin-protein ligase ATL6-like [Olea europaea var. sylvestris]|uniref:E3 ubiquitin-protein ligase ATL6-like n=1 Tax=Olea europaea var. sylvestris TaxID=158386 RepID=UPI000C1D8B2D|nr:E3 ubiquitin-protein ligase ATL6-like [Olea europaea var. sylvestris]
MKRFFQDGVVLLLSLFVLLLFSEISLVGAQSTPPGDNNGYQYAKFNPSMAIIIVVLIAALFFMGFFSIYIRHCSDDSGAAGSVRQALSIRTRRAAAARGLDASVLETFPTFSYSEVKDHKIGKGALECAVCLNEFEDDETIRLIPKCDHVFHPQCIDAWLESHVTCPVCRANLVPVSTDGPIQEPENEENNENIERTNSSRNEQVVIQVEICDENQPQRQEETMNRNSSFHYQNRSVRRPKMFGIGKFRSHSTGHSLSLVRPGENLDRFTLKLPEQVRKEVMERAMLNRTKSCAITLPREGSSRRGPRGFNRASSFFSRALSMRSPRVVAENGEGSTSRAGGMPVKMPSFKCLEPKALDETHLVSDDSARHPV